MKKKHKLIPFRATACSMYFLQFGFLSLILLLLLFADPVFLPARICQAAGQQESIYLSKNLSSYYDQLKNLPIIEMIIRNGEEFAISVEVETQGGSQPIIWIDYSPGERTRSMTQGGVIKVPIEKQDSSAWMTLQLNVSDDLQWAQYNFSSIKKVSVRGTLFDLQKIRFSSPSLVNDELVIDFPSKEVKTISELGWSSNNNQKCFQILQDKDSLGNSFPYLRSEGGIIQNTPPLLPSSSSGSGTSASLAGMNTGWYPPVDYRYSMGYYPYSMMPYSYMSPFSSFGLGMGGGPFGMGYGLGGSPLLAMGIFGSPLLLGGGLGGLYGGGLYGGGLYGGGLYGGGLYGGGLYGGGLYGLGGVGGILGSSLGGGLFGLSGLQNPLLGVSTGDTFYNKLFSLLFDGAVPVSTVPIVLESPPISTVLPPTSTVPAVNLTPVISTTFFTGGGGGGGGGFTGTGGGISGGGFTGGGGGIGGGGLIP